MLPELNRALSAAPTWSSWGIWIEWLLRIRVQSLLKPRDFLTIGWPLIMGWPASLTRAPPPEDGHTEVLNAPFLTKKFVAPRTGEDSFVSVNVCLPPSPGFRGLYMGLKPVTRDLDLSGWPASASLRLSSVFSASISVSRSLRPEISDMSSSLRVSRKERDMISWWSSPSVFLKSTLFFSRLSCKSVTLEFWECILSDICWNCNCSNSLSPSKARSLFSTANWIDVSLRGQTGYWGQWGSWS